MVIVGGKLRQCKSFTKNNGNGKRASHSSLGPTIGNRLPPQKLVQAGCIAQLRLVDGVVVTDHSAQVAGDPTQSTFSPSKPRLVQEIEGIFSR
jgi:hypothetical protein